MPSMFLLQEAGPGIHAAIAPRVGGPAISNAAIVDLGDKTIVVDSFMTIAAADELRETARALTGRDVLLVVSTHFHRDHVGGNSAFADLPIVSTRVTLDLMAADSAADAAAYGAEIDATLAAARSAVEQADSAEAAAAAADLLAMAEAMDATRDRYRLTLPDLLIGDRLVIEGSERSAEIVSPGRGHTASDVFVHVADAGVVVAGDLVWEGTHPKLDDGHPSDWAGSVDTLAGCSPRAVVPGHGPVAGAASLEHMAAYLRAVDGMVAAARSGDLDPADAPAPAGSEAWGGIERLRRGIAALAS